MTAMHDRLKSWLWPLLPKPWDAPDMEARYGLWSGVSALYSESGRQLGEANARPFILNHRVSAETIACKYEGSRYGRAINMSALRIAMRHFEGALEITGAVRRFHLDRVGRTGPAGLWDLYLIARASIALVAWRQRSRSGAPPGGRVPDLLASQYQFISGIFMICRDMMDRADPRIAANTVVTASDLYALADDHGIFLSPGGMACAGSTRRILDFMGYCVHGALEGSEDGAPGLSAGPLDLSGLASDPERWYRYAMLAVELDFFLDRERLRRLVAAEPAGAGQHAASADIRAAIAGYCAQALGAEAPDHPDADFAAAVTARQNVILRLLGRPVLRAMPHRHLAERLGG